MSSTLTSSNATRREWIGLAVLALPCLLYSMDLTVLNLALPLISKDFKPTGTQLLWIVDIYGFLVAGSLITMGALGDRIGRRKLLMNGAVAFALASIAAAFSRSAAMLIAMRAVLGLAGATLAPSTLSLIRNMFLDSKQRSVAISVWITSYSVGGAIGPLLGGAVLAHFWWGAVFLLGVPVMVLLLVLGPIFLPEYRDPNAGHADVFSAALSLAAVLGVIYGIKRIAESGLGWWPVGVMAMGAIAGVAFVRRQKKLSNPFIDPRLFQAPAFGASLAIYLIATFVAFGAFVFISQYLQLVLGLSPFHAGLWTLPSMGAFVVGSLLCPTLVRHARPVNVIAVGFAIAAVGFGMITQLDGHFGPRLLLVAFGLYSLGLAPAFTLSTDLIVGSAPPERAGAASAISETSSEFGGAVGVAILGSVGLALYRRLMATSNLDGIPRKAMQVARDTLGGAAATAAQLPDSLGAALLKNSHRAFTEVLQLIATINVVISLAAAVMTLAWLRNVGIGKK